MNNRSQNPKQGQQAGSQQNQDRQDQKNLGGAQNQQNLGGRSNQDNLQNKSAGKNDQFPGRPSTVYAGHEKNESIETAQGNRGQQGGRNQNQGQRQNQSQSSPGRSPSDDEEE